MTIRQKPRRGGASRAGTRTRAPVKKRTLTLYNEEEESTDGTETPPQLVNNKSEQRTKISFDREEAESTIHTITPMPKNDRGDKGRFLEGENGN